MAEVIVLGEQLVVHVLHLEEVVHLILWIDGDAAVFVPAHMGLEFFKDITANQHEPSPDVLDLKRQVGIDHVVTVELVDVEDAGQAGQIRVVEHSALAHLVPVDALHWDRPTDDALVGLDHPGDVVRHKLLVSVNEHQVGGILHLEEVVGDGIAPTLHQTLVAEEDAGHLDAVLQACLLERQQGLDRKSTRLNSSHIPLSRMPSSA